MLKQIEREITKDRTESKKERKDSKENMKLAGYIRYVFGR